MVDEWSGLAYLLTRKMLRDIIIVMTGAPRRGAKLTSSTNKRLAARVRTARKSPNQTFIYFIFLHRMSHESHAVDNLIVHRQHLSVPRQNGKPQSPLNATD